MAKQKKDDFYVGIGDPIAIRKSVLEAVKGMVEVLQRLELIKELRKDKLEAIEMLRTLTKETASLVMQLRNKLPKPSKEMTDELKSFIRIEKKVEKDEHKEEVVESVHQTKPHALTKLESELEDIEKELEKLGK